MSPVLNPPRSAPAQGPKPAVLIGIAGAAAGALALVLLLRWLIPSVPFVDRITVVNPTVFHIEVEVGSAEDHGGLVLGAVAREQTQNFTAVLDQGRRWVFRFSSGGKLGGHVVLSRHEMESSGWRVSVPPEVGERLQANGLLPSAPE
jgi:hypothetical protein